jgi:type IV secretion system protein VirB9
MPAVYATDAEGRESLVNAHVDGNQIVVHRLVRKLTLRKGNAVACVVNRSFDLDGGKDNRSGTVSPDVQRVIRGGQ